MEPGELNCPQCGAAVSVSLRYSKLVVCGSCQSTLFLEDESVVNAGIRSSLVKDPSLLQLGQTFTYKTWTFTPLGRVRFEYEGGYWDEWWVLLDTGKGQWISVDEGDFAIEIPKRIDNPPSLQDLRVGEMVQLAGQKLKVTERHRATCTGFEGELPEVNFPGDVHDYVHFSGPRGLIVTGEWFKGERQFFEGRWVDPFEIKSV
ncbi:MAG: DUF4178 domain-containing protein [Gammaproteobacteria bacterium]|nr:DUF4178 domain-containing protein [Gammaproteobacteria bacterium]